MHYYPIPEASKYEVGSDSYIYRILKCGRRKKLRRHLYRRTGGKGDWQTTIVFDDGKRRTVRPDYLAVELGPSVAETRSRDHGKDYIETILTTLPKHAKLTWNPSCKGNEVGRMLTNITANTR